MDKSAIVVVSFGTTDHETMEKTIGAVERAAAAQGRGVVRRAFTSGVVIRKLQQRGIFVDTPREALEKLRAEGVRKVTLLPTFLVPGGEYRKLLETVLPMKPCFDALEVLPTLMADRDAVRRLAAVLREIYPPEEREAVLFMGHGTDGEGNGCYRELEEAFDLPGMYVALLNGAPDFSEGLAQILAAGYTGVRLVPLMLSAGVHAAEHMAGTGPQSWASRCTAAGLTVRCRMTGLGELEAVRQLYVAALKGENRL